MRVVNDPARRFSRRSAALILLGLAAAAPASVLSTAETGLWEITRTGAGPVRLCVAKIDALAQFEQRGTKCDRDIIREGASSATVHYTCPGGAFGESVISLVTPRSLRVATQGISAGAPFNYIFQARRVGDCPAH